MSKELEKNIQYKIIKSEACGHSIQYKMIKSDDKDMTPNPDPKAPTHINREKEGEGESKPITPAQKLGGWGQSISPKTQTTNIGQYQGIKDAQERREKSKSKSKELEKSKADKGKSIEEKKEARMDRDGQYWGDKELGTSHGVHTPTKAGSGKNIAYDTTKDKEKAVGKIKFESKMNVGKKPVDLPKSEMMMKEEKPDFKKIFKKSESGMFTIQYMRLAKDDAEGGEETVDFGDLEKAKVDEGKSNIEKRKARSRRGNAHSNSGYGSYSTKGNYYNTDKDKGVHSSGKKPGEHEAYSEQPSKEEALLNIKYRSKSNREFHQENKPNLPKSEKMPEKKPEDPRHRLLGANGPRYPKPERLPGDNGPRKPKPERRPDDVDGPRYPKPERLPDFKDGPRKPKPSSWEEKKDAAKKHSLLKEEFMEKSRSRNSMTEHHKAAAEHFGDDYHEASPSKKEEMAKKMQQIKMLGSDKDKGYVSATRTASSDSDLEPQGSISGTGSKSRIFNKLASSENFKYKNLQKAKVDEGKTDREKQKARILRESKESSPRALNQDQYETAKKLIRTPGVTKEDKKKLLSDVIHTHKQKKPKLPSKKDLEYPMAASEKMGKCIDNPDCGCQKGKKLMKKSEKFYIQKIQQLRKAGLPNGQDAQNMANQVADNARKNLGGRSITESAVNNMLGGTSFDNGSQFSNWALGKENAENFQRNQPKQQPKPLSSLSPQTVNNFSGMVNPTPAANMSKMPDTSKPGGMNVATQSASTNTPGIGSTISPAAQAAAPAANPAAAQAAANPAAAQAAAPAAQAATTETFGQAFKKHQADRQKAIANNTYDPKTHDTFEWTNPKTGKKGSYHSFSQDEFNQGLGAKYNPAVKQGMGSTPYTPSTSEQTSPANQTKATSAQSKMGPTPSEGELKDTGFNKNKLTPSGGPA